MRVVSCPLQFTTPFAVPRGQFAVALVYRVPHPAQSQPWGIGGKLVTGKEGLETPSI